MPVRGDNVAHGGQGPTTFLSETVRRVMAAVVFLPIFYILVHDLGPVAFLGLVTLSGMLTVAEFYRLHLAQTPWPWWSWVGVAATGLLLSSTQWPTFIADRTVLLGTVLLALCMPLLSGKPLRDSLTDGMVLVMGVLYIGLSISHLLLIRALPDGALLIFFVVLVTWAADTGAYIAGKSVGRHPLAPVSARKKPMRAWREAFFWPAWGRSRHAPGSFPASHSSIVWCSA